MADPNRLAFDIAQALHRMGTGDLAVLRRAGDPTAAPAFWRLAARHDDLARGPDRWGPIVQALAVLTPKGAPENRPARRAGDHDRAALIEPARRLGEALCDACDPAWHEAPSPRPLLSERRLAQLLAARGATRRTLLLRAVRALAARRDPRHGLDVGDLAWAFLHAGDPGRIAGPYYRRLDRAGRGADTPDTETTQDA